MALFRVARVPLLSARGLLAVEGILYRCGKDMAKRNGLCHWDNSHLKTALIVCLCALKNSVFLVWERDKAVATFQTKRMGNRLRFQKLATDPSAAGRGIGTFCLEEIERQALAGGCQSVFCEVYDKSEHAIAFYEHRGYTAVGKAETVKYTEQIMEKKL